MDRTDRAIIDELRRDGRLTNVELAQRVGLTAAPCLRRVRQLEEDGVIVGYHARVDPAALDRGFEVLVNVDLATKDRDVVLGFEEHVATLDEVVECRRMFGLPDYFLRVALPDLAAYEAFATDGLGAIPGVAQIDSRLTMKVIKAEPA
ncbi:Lrp/AsnC family transcriptional regulator [Patulibacter sp. SYSU D01012]|uniref:Lrp/AsnC family transcriptional regulator n=1 Tax=Patulibacter sp. SYSU D01012 TaxID=2817381 RepID=UPI001B30760A